MTDLTHETPQILELRNKVAELSQAILGKHPAMPTLLKQIHTTLRAQPENVTLLSEEEIGIIVSGLKVQTNTEFASSAVKGKAAPSAIANIKKLGADAF